MSRTPGPQMQPEKLSAGGSSAMLVLEKLGLRYIAMTDRYYRDRLRLYRLSRNTWRVRSAAGDGADAD